MNDAHQDQDDFDSFENLDDGMGMPDDGSQSIDDAEFQDLPDDVDADVFGEDMPEQAPKAKKTNWFNIGVAVVAIVVAGGLVWMKLGPQILGSTDSPPPPIAGNNNPGGITGADLAASSSPQQSQNAAQAAVQSKDAPAQTGGLLGNPDQLAALGKAKAPDNTTATPSAGAIADPFAALANNAPVTAAAPAPTDAGVPMPTPISATPTTVTASATVPVAKDAAVVDPLPTPVETTAPAPKTSSSNSDGALKGQVDALSQRLDAMDAKITSAVDKINNAPQVDNARLTTIQTTLERLEARLDNMGTSKPAIREVASRDVPDEVTSTPRPARTVKKAAKKSTKPRAQNAQWDEPYRASGAVQAIDVAAPAPAKGTGGWMLKGAQPGKAVIGKASGDIREVSVGDSVPGLGEVTGVASVNGRWVVQGTEGRLAQ